METQKFTKKPLEVEAVLVTENNMKEIWEWIGENGTEAFLQVDYPPAIKIQTLEGIMAAYVGSYVIKGLEGEFYPCKASVFEATYEIVVPVGQVL